MRIEVERIEGTAKAGRTVKRWTFYVRMDHDRIRLLLDRYVRGAIAPGKRKLDVEIGYDRHDPRLFFGAMRLDRDLVNIPRDVAQEATERVIQCVEMEA